MKAARHILLVLLLFCLGSPAYTQEDVLVRSGEHANFSRLVVEFDPENSWELAPNPRGYALTFTGPGINLDLSQVYRLIPKRRLLSISRLASPRSGALLVVANDHYAQAFVLKPGVLVIDIKIGEAEFPKRIQRDDAWVSTQAADTAKAEETPQSLAAPPASQSPNAPTEYAITPVPPEFRLPDVKILAAEKKLGSTLQLAIRQGLVTASADTESTSLSEPHQQSEPRDAPGAQQPDQIAQQTDATATPPDVNYLDHLNINAQTVINRDRAGLIKTAKSQSGASECLKDPQLDVFNWYGDLPTDEAFSPIGWSIAGELDKPDPTALEHLVKRYVVLGFGVEARALLNSFPGALDNQELLAELADIIELGHAKNSQILASQVNCKGRSAFWAILARDHIPLGEIPDFELLHREFTELPADLRHRIGPILGTRLLDAGFLDGAIEIDRLIARAPGPDSPAYILLHARINLQTGRSKEADKALARLVAKNSPNAASALSYLVSNRLSQKQRIPISLISETAARAFELRNSSIGRELQRLEILSWATRQQQGIAFEVLTHAAVLETIGAKLANQIADEVFLSFDLSALKAEELVQSFFRYRYLLTEDPAMDRARRHIARGLMDAGLAQTALQTLQVARFRFSEQDRELLGEIFLKLGQPERSLEALKGLRTEATTGLRIAALSHSGAHAQAFETDALSLERDDLAWRAGKWESLLESKMDSRNVAAHYILESQKQDGVAPRDPHGNVPVLSPQEITLERANSLVQQSKKTRNDITQLLQDHPTP